MSDLTQIIGLGSEIIGKLRQDIPFPTRGYSVHSSIPFHGPRHRSSILDHRLRGILYIIPSLFLLFILDLLSPNSALADPLGPFSWKGQVVEKGTGVPIEGAVIIRSWHREWASPAGRGSKAFAIRETLSGRNGRFTISSSPFTISLPILYKLVENSTMVFKPGYKFLTRSNHPAVIEMEKIPATYYVRYEEAEKAQTMNFEWGFYNTELLKEVVNKEEAVIRGLPRYVPGVFYQRFSFEKDNLRIPSDLAVDTAGTLYVADRNTIYKISKKGDLLDRKEFSSPHNDIEFDLEGNLCALISDYLLKIDSSHFSPRAFIPIPKDKKMGGFSSSARFAMGLNDQIFVINKITGIYSDSKTIFIFDKEGSFLQKYEVEENDTQSVGEKIRLTDLASDGQGNIFVGYSFYNPVWDTGRNRYSFRNGISKLDKNIKEVFDRKVDLDGKQLRSITTTSNGELMVASEDCVYIYDKNLNLAFKETLSGKELGRVDISRMKVDRKGEYLYLIEDKYRRILRYDLRNKILPQRESENR